METLKERRKKLRMSQKDMAELLDVERSTVAKWEAGTLPRSDKIIAIAALLKCSVDELLTLFKKPAPKTRVMPKKQQ